VPFSRHQAHHRLPGPLAFQPIQKFTPTKSRATARGAVFRRDFRRRSSDAYTRVPRSRRQASSDACTPAHRCAAAHLSVLKYSHLGSSMQIDAALLQACIVALRQLQTRLSPRSSRPPNRSESGPGFTPGNAPSFFPRNGCRVSDLRSGPRPVGAGPTTRRPGTATERGSVRKPIQPLLPPIYRGERVDNSHARRPRHPGSHRIGFGAGPLWRTWPPGARSLEQELRKNGPPGGARIVRVERGRREASRGKHGPGAA